MTDTQPDRLLRFLFSGAPVKGSWVALNAGWQAAQARRPLPLAVQAPAGALMAAITLLASSLKFEGALIGQIQAHGPVTLMAAEARGQGQWRMVVRWDEQAEAEILAQHELALADLLREPRHLVLSLLAPDGAIVHQGMVDCSGPTVTGWMEGYMAQSAQIPTRLWLAANGERAVGLMLQRLPDGHGDVHAWEHLQVLTDTVQSEELLSLDAETLLHRLYHQEELQVLVDETPVYTCSCSHQKVLNTLQLLGQVEVEQALQEHGGIMSVGCEYCGQQYPVTRAEAMAVFVSAATDSGSLQ